MLTDASWSGSRCFVVGAGPSLTGFDFSLLAGERWIGINSLYLQNPTVAYTEDLTFLRAAMRLASYLLAECRKVYHCLNEKDHAELAPISLDRPPDALCTPLELLCNHPHRGNKWATSLADHLPIGPTTAISAVNLAAVLGANPICLLGMDCRASEPLPETVPLEVRTGRVRSGEIRTHFDERAFPRPPEWKTGWNKYRDWINAWEGFVAPEAEAHGVKIINVINPEFPSALICFETKTFAEVFPSCRSDDS